MKVPSTTKLSFPTLSPLLTAGKNIVGYFLDSPRIIFISMPRLSTDLLWTEIQNARHTLQRTRDKYQIQQILQNMQYMLLIIIIHVAEMRILLKRRR
jgi:hypothetical protein